MFFSRSNSLNEQNLISTHEACMQMLIFMIDNYSKEYDFILDLIEISLSIDALVAKKNLSQLANLVLMNLHEKGFANLTNLIERWFKKELNQSILIGFQIKKYDQHDIDANKRLIDEYRKAKISGFNSNTMVLEGAYSDGMPPRSSEDIRRQIVYFGLTNESEIYHRFFSYNLDSNTKNDFVKFLINKLFYKRVSDRIDRGNFGEVIRFRKLFDFNSHFGKTYGALFIKTLNEIIIHQLHNSSSDQEQDLTTLCSEFRDKTVQNQELLDFFIEHLLKQIVPTRIETISQVNSEFIDLEFLIGWSSIIKFVSLDVDAKSKGLSEPLNNRLWYARFYNELFIAFMNTINNIISSNEKIAYIKLFQQNLKKSYDLYVLMKNKLKFEFVADLKNFEAFSLMIDIRIKEANQFEVYRQQLKKFVKFCTFFKHIDVHSLKKQIIFLDKMNNLELSLKLNDVCKTLDLSEVNQNFSLSTYEPVVIYFEGVRSQFMSFIFKINELDLRFCKIFNDYFHDASQTLLTNDLKMSLYHLIEQSWSIVHEKWREISRSIESGNIKLVRLDLLRQKYFKDNFELFQNELIYINTYFKISRLEYRNKQIILYNRFVLSYNAAIEIRQIHDKLILENKFNELDDLLIIKSESFNEWDLNRMDQRIEKIVSVLDRFNDQERIFCLNAFAQSMEFVEWLRENAPSLIELKTLVDLASMSNSSSTGKQVDANIDNTVFAKILKEAGSAYAFLIYELKPDVNFFEFMHLCEKVCSHLESDKNIAHKLLAIKEKVELLEEIKKRSGNVELSSLELAKEINQHGIYKLSLDSRVGSHESVKLEDLITLEIESTGASYNLDNLLELQYVLMLIAPRRTKKIDKTKELMDTQESVPDIDEDTDETRTLEYFSDLFSNVNRLAEICMKLVQNGCLFFDQFNIKIYSDILNERLINKESPMIELKLNYNNIQIDDCKNSTLDSIRNLGQLIETTYDSWSSFISLLRDNYHALNFFTLNQIKFLLVNMNSLMTENCKPFEFDMMLSIMSIINQDIDANFLINASKKKVNEDKIYKITAPR
jgi:hypothetical protein